MAVEDTFINQKGMHPFWIFSDMFGGKHVGGKFLCFINAHFPEEMVSMEESVNQRGAEKLKNGTWKADRLAESEDKSVKIGWGVGDTPQVAFRKACYSSGYLKTKDAT